MPNNGNQNTIVNQYRRKTLLSGAAFLAVNLVASPGFACGGGGGGDEQSEQSSTTKKKPKTKKEKQSTVTISQAKFLRMSHAEIRKHLQNGSTTRIEGFAGGSEILWDMAYYGEYKLTRKLVKDMAKLKTFKTRKEHLKKEAYRVKKLIKELKKEKDNLPKTDAPETEKLLSKIFKKKTKADEIDARLESLSYYAYGVTVWSKHPELGTLK